MQNMANQLTILVPAYNEAASIVDTIKSIQNQTTPPKRIIVIDDYSTDNTGELAVKQGVEVIRPPKNTGTKAGAQNFGLDMVDSKYTMAIDADTTLASDAIEKLMQAFDNDKVAAVCGTVIPRYINTIWERGRYIEYLFAFSFYKQIQNYFEKPLISSGCFSAYLTSKLKENGGWHTRTMAEDMDLTWSFYQKGFQIKFVPEAVCYPIEPNNFDFMRKQLKRWTHGFMQNVKLHWKGVSKHIYLRSMVFVSLWDSVIASIAYLVLIPILSIYYQSPVFLLAYIIDMPAILPPILYKSVKRNEFTLALSSIPSFLILRTVNCFFVLEAFFSELVLGNKLTVYEKGH